MNREVTSQITESLERIETEENVRILYACESGSRAWGFESADSDYDVRFVYVHPVEWYLTVQQKRDVIELPINEVLDINGWDLPKALGLLRKSNPPLLEWFQSPIVYREDSGFAEGFRKLMLDYYSPKSCMYHYLHMARGNNREFLQGDQVKTKKYFYVLRPVLACLWIERGLGIVPTEFSALVDRIVEDKALREEIGRLVAEKRSGAEMDSGPRIPVISEFINRELERLSGEAVDGPEYRDPAELDRFFVETLVGVFGDKVR